MYVIKCTLNATSITIMKMCSNTKNKQTQLTDFFCVCVKANKLVSTKIICWLNSQSFVKTKVKLKKCKSKILDILINIYSELLFLFANNNKDVNIFFNNIFKQYPSAIYEKISPDTELARFKQVSSN